MMMKTMILTAALAFGLATAASAGITPAPLGNNSLIIKVAEGCGPGQWRGPKGVCHPYALAGICGPGYHLGPDGRRCWPNELMGISGACPWGYHLGPGGRRCFPN